VSLSLMARLIRDDLLRRFGTSLYVGGRTPLEVISYFTPDLSMQDKRALKNALEEMAKAGVARVQGETFRIDSVANREIAATDVGREVAVESAPADPILFSGVKREEREEREISSICVESGASAEEPSSNPTRTDKVGKVFAHWQTVMAHPGAKLSPKRVKLIERALADYGLDPCLAAIDGCAKSDWHMARDPKNRTTFYNSIELIFRDSEKIERFIAIAGRPAEPASEPAPKKLTAEERGLLVRGNMRENNDRLHRLREGLPPPTPEELASIRDGSMELGHVDGEWKLVPRVIPPAPWERAPA
jgi:hypothetical protein